MGHIKNYVAQDKYITASSSAEVEGANSKVSSAGEIDQDPLIIGTQDGAGSIDAVFDKIQKNFLKSTYRRATELLDSRSDYSDAAKNTLEVGYDGTLAGGYIVACLKRYECWQRNAEIAYPHIRRAGDFAYNYALDYPWQVGILGVHFTLGPDVVATSVLKGVGFDLYGMRAEISELEKKGAANMKFGVGYALHFFKSQLFAELPYPNEDWSGKTVIVTGSNTGLGLETARHFARLKASRVILAVRNLDKGRAAKRDIDSSLPSLSKSNLTSGDSNKGKPTGNDYDDSHDAVQVWQLDLSSQASVKEFAARCRRDLDRIDAFVSNAGLSASKFEKTADGDEVTIGVNVIANFLLTFSLMPKLKETASRFNVRPIVVIVASEAHLIAKFREKHAVDKLDLEQQQIATEANSNKSKWPLFDVLADPAHFSPTQRYPLSKLLDIMIVREFAVRYPTSDGYPVTINCTNPGLCHSELSRGAPWPVSIFKWLLARKTEVGSRTSVNAAAEVDGAAKAGMRHAPSWTHGKYLSDCREEDVDDWIESDEGKKWQKRIWDELSMKLETAEPGVVDSL
ncbi:MAG: hypothetical protein M1831_006077 [Alyxoria varia]|nr:MAG: hypothetical protein M1831_006077 [Alyxoria varia]